MRGAEAMLSGVCILELGQVIAGTYGGTLLADMGADVIKIEPLHGDAARNRGIAPVKDESAIHLSMNRGKKSVALDLKNPDGLRVFQELVKQADAIIDNFRPGVMGRLGIDHESLVKIKPDIITCAITGFGEYGPARDRPAFDLVVQAYSGHLHITGDPDGPPARVGIPLADIAGGMFACTSILGALVGRLLHGNGQHIDVSMLDALVSLLAYDALHYLNTGTEVGRLGTAHAHMVPWQAFAVRDGYVVVAAREEKFWIRLCEAIGRPDLRDDARAVDNRTRVANRDFVVGVLEEAFLKKGKVEWVGILEQHDIPAAPVNDLPAVFSDPHVLTRGLVQTYEHPTAGPIRYTPGPMQFSEWDRPNEHAPVLGEHSKDVLRQRLGYAAEDIDRLISSGAVGAWSPTEHESYSSHLAAGETR